MTDKEYINNIKTISTEDLLNNLEDYGYDPYYRDLYKATMRELKERSRWHKVADGDLPKYAGLYFVICGDESLPEYDVDFYENYKGGKRWVHNEGRIIAWTELPEYKEK